MNLPSATAAKMQARSLIFELRAPTGADDWKPIYICGSFNNWKTTDERYRLHFVRKGVWQIKMPKELIRTPILEYKYVRGTWGEQELNILGHSISNRIIREPAGRIKDRVARWDNKHSNLINKSFSPKIELVSDRFEVPQLETTRGVFALLPYDYYQNPHKHYPVLYLNDAQNLFNPQSKYGNWAIDEKMAALAERGYGEVIIIAVEHGEENRINEFSPIRTKFGEGKARRYVRFLAETLKPAIDAKYRTIPDRSHTGIGGSSMGGLVSIYAGLVFPKVFGRLMIFSPSLWLTQNINFNTIAFYDPEPTRIYCYGGSQEGSKMITRIRDFRDSIIKRKFNSDKVAIEVSIDPEGKHSEWRWGAEFPRAVRWLFFEK